MKKKYHIVTRADEQSASILQQFCQTNGQILLPLVEKIQSASDMVNSVIHELSLKTLETILVLSAEQIAGPRTPGRASDWWRRLHRSQRKQASTSNDLDSTLQ